MAYRSIVTIRADIVRKFFGATGRSINVAVLGSGIDGSPPHFRRHRNLNLPEPLKHRDFLHQGNERPLMDSFGLGTGVAGIIAGELFATETPISAQEEVPQADGTLKTEESRIEWISGVAPECRVISYKVLDDEGMGDASCTIAAMREIARVNDSKILIHV